MIKIAAKGSLADANNLELRTNRLYSEHQQRIYRQTDKLFIVLMMLQWAFGILLAFMISPQTWIGATPHVHIHVWAAIFLGGTISVVPIVMCIMFPGTTLTRHVVAISQACWSGLLIHLCGGRIEAHFHVFGSLAILAFYRDWRVVLTASAIVTADHFIRGMWWPQSVYGVAIESQMRWMEHAGWVVFEDIFLIISCVRGCREGRLLCERQAELESTNSEIENRIDNRTAELRKAHQLLENELDFRIKSQIEREKLYSELSAVSRKAGMAEVATGVLHNVGNVLNSVNVSANLLIERMRSSRLDRLTRASQLIYEHRDEMVNFVQSDRGQNLPEVLVRLSDALNEERDDHFKELRCLLENIEHVKEIVATQQSFAGYGGANEMVDLADLVDVALKINNSITVRHDIELVCEIHDVPSVCTDKHKLLQILVNLISNAKHALVHSENKRKAIKVSVTIEDGLIHVSVSDNGIGIDPENINKIFTHGYTTKKKGHGFGLHSSALAAQDMGGAIRVHSEGINRGAKFTLQLPLYTSSLCPG